MAVKIIIDSASDIQQDEAKKLGIIVLPIEINFSGESYLDGVNIGMEDFYKKLETFTELPKTAQINEARFEDVFKSVTDDGDEAVVIVISSALSGTYNSAKRASEKFSNKIFVLDSIQASAGERILCYYALQLKNKGFSAEQIYNELEKVKEKATIVAAIDTLKYLKKGGRISPLVAFAGELMSIKPIIGLSGDGKLKLLAKPIGIKKRNLALVETIKKTSEIDLSMPHVLIYSGTSTAYLDEFIENYLKILGMEDNVPKFFIGCTIGTHIGPGAIGVVYFKK